MTVLAALTVGLLLCAGPAAAWYVERCCQRDTTPAPAPGPPAAEPALTAAEHGALERARLWAAGHPAAMAAARAQADTLRLRFPGLGDTQLGRLCYHMSRVHQGCGTGGHDPGDLTAMLALAAVELCGLELGEEVAR